MADDFLLKWLLPLAALVAVVFLVRNQRHHVRRKIVRPTTFIEAILPFISAMLCAMAIWAAAHAANLPQRIQLTDPHVLADKLSRRELCHRAWMNGSALLAESIIRNNSLGRDMHAYMDQTGRPDMNSVVARWGSRPFFFFGMCWTILPCLACMFVVPLFHNRSKVDLSMLPVVTPIIAMTCAAFLIYHVMISPSQSSQCLLASGHWYTWFLTTLASIITLMKFWTVPYFWWTIMYQFLAMSVLRNSQRYYHDDKEAMFGLDCAMMASPAVLVVGFVASQM